ncbi:DEAD/DEAH box helicase [Sphingobacterium daejeonense]|uniref:DEAD/DEAH box helicase n=1 Tax=Sphingobacterium daejeonense TaxID=371142 RepID=UPI0021A35F83|nr:DEAD/DEAH box helicase [Sphingobacterium daejeonense]MCT1531474.1 DEAD/DEAH box helicase [Sphingobacterium daejeonense]
MQHLNTYLKNLNIQELNPMQEEVLEKFNPEKDFVLLSPTGSGKTLAFSLLLFNLLGDNLSKGTNGLIVVPTRELALQIESVIKQMNSSLNVALLYGGNNNQIEKDKLKQHPPLIIGTPGRIIYHIERNPALLENCHTLVLDEFDKSLELGFQDQLSYIVKSARDVRHKILTSATDMEEIPSFLQLNDPIKLDYFDSNGLRPDLSYFKVISSSKLKLESLFKLLCKIGNERVLVFCNHREAVDNISDILEGKGIESIPYHGGLEQFMRELTIIKIKNGSQNILITTDLAARGLDIPEMNHVVHYQFPYKEEDFIHRNGRAGRNGQKGFVYGILTEEDRAAKYLEEAETLELDGFYPIPEEPEFKTLRINAGKKQKVNKIDIVGYILNLPEISKEDLGLIVVKPNDSYVAIRAEVANKVVKNGSNGKIKGQKVRISLI